MLISESTAPALGSITKHTVLFFMPPLSVAHSPFCLSSLLFSLPWHKPTWGCRSPWPDLSTCFPWLRYCTWFLQERLWGQFSVTQCSKYATLVLNDMLSSIGLIHPVMVKWFPLPQISNLTLPFKEVGCPYCLKFLFRLYCIRSFLFLVRGR